MVRLAYDEEQTEGEGDDGWGMMMEMTYDYMAPEQVRLAPEERDLTGESVVRSL